jgi:hypothetical protein
VRLLVADGKSHGLGAANIYIRPQSPPTSSTGERQANHEAPVSR